MTMESMDMFTRTMHEPVHAIHGMLRVTVRGSVQQVQYGLASEEKNDANLIMDMKGKQRTSELVHMIQSMYYITFDWE